MRISNSDLVRGLKAGHRASCHQVMAMYRRPLLKECVRAFRVDPLDAEEIVDDVLLSVIRKIGQFHFRRSESDFHFWVMAIFRNRLRDFVRRRTAHGMSVMSADRGCLDSNGSGEDQAMVQASIRAFEQSTSGGEDSDQGPAPVWVAEALNRMEPWERVLLQCRALDVPYAEIARYAGKPPHQLKVYYARVKKKFAQLLFAQHPEIKGFYEAADGRDERNASQAPVRRSRQSDARIAAPSGPVSSAPEDD